MTDYVPEEMVEEFREAFSLFDHDGDGSITTDELLAELRKLGQNPTEAELKVLLKEFDSDGDGHLDFQEFSELMCKKMKDTEGDEAIRDAFDTLDMSGKGKVTAEELTDVMVAVGHKVQKAEVVDMMKDIRTKEARRMDYEDFKYLAQSLMNK